MEVLRGVQQCVFISPSQLHSALDQYVNTLRQLHPRKISFLCLVSSRSGATPPQRRGRSHQRSLQPDGLQITHPCHPPPPLIGCHGSISAHLNLKINLVIKMLNKDSNSEISNVNAEALFDQRDLKRCYDNMTKSNETAETNIIKYLFAECVGVGKRTETKGSARGH